MVKIFLHKIQISTNDANFIDSPMITIACISITCLNSSPQYKGNVHTATTIFLTDTTNYHKSPSPWDNLWQGALLHYNENILLPTSLVVSLWLRSLIGSSASFLGNCWSSALTPCTWNRWYGSGPSWNSIYFSSWTFPFQSELLFHVSHTLLPLSGILLDPHSDNFGRCVHLLHMNSMNWCRV